MTLNIIKAHAGSEPIIARHLEHWKRQPGKLLFVCPTDQIISGYAPVTTLNIEPRLKERFGSTASMKQLLALAKVWCESEESGGFSAVCIQEYDSLFLDATQVKFKPGVFQCNWSISADPRFSATGYSHPPLHMTVDILQRLVDVLTFLPDNAEGGYWDRAFGWAIESAGIPFEPWPKGVTRNTIELNQIGDLRLAVLDGCNAIHGLKSKVSYETAVEAHKER